MLPHLSGLSDLTEARVIKGWERERCKKKKRAEKVQATQRGIERRRQSRVEALG